MVRYISSKVTTNTKINISVATIDTVNFRNLVVSITLTLLAHLMCRIHILVHLHILLIQFFCLHYRLHLYRRGRHHNAFQIHITLINLFGIFNICYYKHHNHFCHCQKSRAREESKILAIKIASNSLLQWKKSNQVSAYSRLLYSHLPVFQLKFALNRFNIL